MLSFIQVGVSPNFKLVPPFAPFTTLPGLAPARAAAALVCCIVPFLFDFAAKRDRSSREVWVVCLFVSLDDVPSVDPECRRDSPSRSAGACLLSSCARPPPTAPALAPTSAAPPEVPVLLPPLLPPSQLLPLAGPCARPAVEGLRANSVCISINGDIEIFPPTLPALLRL